VEYYKEGDTDFREAAFAKDKSISIHFRFTDVRQRIILAARIILAEYASNKCYRVIKSSARWNALLAKQKHEEILLPVSTLLT